MSRDEIQKLLGGYATGTLTGAEQQALFEAALHDQELFDELAREQPLHDLLRDPAARAHMLAAIDERPSPWYRRLRPAWVGAAAALAAACVLGGIYLRPPKPAAAPVLVAQVKDQAVAAPAPPEPAAKAPPATARRAPVRKAKPKEEVASNSPDKVVQTEPAPRAAAEPAPAPPPSTRRLAAPEATPKEVASNLLDKVVQAEVAPPAQNARSLFYAPPGSIGSVGGQSFNASAAAVGLGLKWVALRKDAAGLFQEVDPEAIHAGDTVKLRLVPNNDGYLSILENSKPLVTGARVQRLQPFETPELTSAEPAAKRLLIVLTHDAQLFRTPTLFRAAAGQQSVADAAEKANYTVATTGNPVQVNITLKYK